MAAIVGPGGPSTATQFAVDSPGGSVMAGDHFGMTDHMNERICYKYTETRGCTLFITTQPVGAG